MYIYIYRYTYIYIYKIYTTFYINNSVLDKNFSKMKNIFFAVFHGFAGAPLSKDWPLPLCLYRKKQKLSIFLRQLSFKQ